jgi:hypothetical protein
MIVLEAEANHNPVRNFNIQHWKNTKPITVVARSKAWTVFGRSTTGIVGSNPTRGMDVCVRLFCLYCPMCR